MLARRSLELRPQTSILRQPYVAHETLVDCGRAEAIIQQAREQAAAILDQARLDAERLLAQAQSEFWREADDHLNAWEAQRQAMWAELEDSARRLVNGALDTLLDEVPDEARLNAVLRQITRSQSEPVSATLRCHPLDRDALGEHLDDHPDRPWKIVADAELPRHALQLVTEGGDFRLDWETAVTALRLAEVRD